MSEKKSAFSVTCSLLSQFLREKRNLGEPGALDVHQESIKELFRPATTTVSSLPGADVSAETNQDATKSMNLFPQQAGFGCADHQNVTAAREPNKPQLTIFYDGKVLVFDSFPPEKADELMKLAAKGSSEAAGRLPASCPSTSAPDQPGSSELPMPIARRASLHRFFSKRKDRITSKAPYQVNCNASPGDASSSKPEPARSWLGLDSEVSNSSSSS